MQSFLRVAKALGDGTRVRALLALRDSELCLCQLIELLGLAPSTVSKHMTVLHEAGLVQRRKQGRWLFYSLPEPADTPSTVHEILHLALDSLAADPQILADRQTLHSVCQQDLEALAECYRT